MPRTAEDKMAQAFGCIAASAGIGCIILIAIAYEVYQWLRHLGS